MKFGVVTFPGSNCDEDMIYVLRDKLGLKVEELWHKDHDLKGVDFVVLPGGFSYGDYLRSGAIARFSPIMQEVVNHCKKGGYAMGICNGFQILCEAGLVPGTLAHNNNQRFICKNVHLLAQSKTAGISSAIPQNKVLEIPIAHGEGRYFASDDVIKGINDNDQVIFRYCDAEGNINEAANPNGSMENIAGVSNFEKNVFGMMPHPERAADETLRNVDGAAIFQSILSSLK
ncbi:MAG: phosphoribosylformylglycinamidine synthase I [Sphingobacteriales bacterium]|jgi:phosphoribosylformylglycinamidine synthase I